LHPQQPVLMQQDLTRFLVARFLGTAANQMLLLALSWQMYDLTGNAMDLGLVGLVQFVPGLLCTIPAGYLVDRIDRRAVLIGSMVIQASVAIGLGWACLGSWVSRDLILLVSVAMGFARALQMPAQQALLPTMVPYENLPHALAQYSAVMKFAVFSGPAAGGFIYLAGASWLYFFCSVLIACSIAFTFYIRPVLQVDALQQVSLGELFVGFRFIWLNKVVLGAMSLDLFATILGGVTALLPIYAKDILHVGPVGLGFLRSAPAVGGFVVALIMSRTPICQHVGRRMFTAVAIYGLACLCFSLSHSFLLSFIALVVSGGADTISVVLRQSLIQLETSDSMRGRVSAVNATFIGASNQLGEFRAGASAHLIGTVSAAVVGAVGTLLVTAIWIRLFPTLTSRDRMLR